MTWQKVVLYVLGGIALIVLGWLLHSAFTPKPTIEIKERVVRDTVETTKTITLRQTNTIYRDTTNLQTISDSIKGTKDEVDYSIKHTLRFAEAILSDWQVEVKPLTKTIVEYVTKDSIRTVVDTKYITKPFFLNEWFYVSIVELVIVILAIIF